MFKFSNYFQLSICSSIDPSDSQLDFLSSIESLSENVLVYRGETILNHILSYFATYNKMDIRECFLKADLHRENTSLFYRKSKERTSQKQHLLICYQ